MALVPIAIRPFAEAACTYPIAILLFLGAQLHPTLVIMQLLLVCTQLPILLPGTTKLLLLKKL